MKTVLIADDSAFMRTVIKDILGGRFAVREAGSGAECLREYERSRPDLVLLDIVMPEGDQEGLRVLRSIVGRDAGAKIVMITALGQQETIVKECLDAGAKGCVVKPFDDSQVLRIVEEWLK